MRLGSSRSVATCTATPASVAVRCAPRRSSRSGSSPPASAVRRLQGTGLVADLGAPGAARRIALRADLDALPIREQTGLDFASPPTA